MKRRDSSPVILLKKSRLFRPLTVFSIAVAISIGLGFSFRLMFSEKVISQYIEYLLKSEHARWQVKISGGQINLSDGLIPVLALKIKTIDIFDPRSQCPGEPKVAAVDIFIPISFFNLIRSNKVIVKEVKIGHLLWNEGIQCEFTWVKGFLSQLSYSEPLVPLRKINITEKAQKITLADRLFSEAELMKYKAQLLGFFRAQEEVIREDIQFPSLSVDTLYLFTKTPFTLKNVKAKVAALPWVVEGNLVEELTGFSRRPYNIPFRVESSKTHLSISTGRSLGEGSWSLDVQAMRKSQDNFETQIRFKSEALPFSLSSALLKKWNYVPIFENMTYLWLTCDASFVMKLATTSSLVLPTKPCQFHGKFGDIPFVFKKMTDTQYSMEMTLTNVPVKEWADYCQQPLECWLAELNGNYTGNVTFWFNKGWRLNGTLDQTDLDVLSSKKKLKASKLQIKDLNLNENLKDWSFEANNNKISLIEKGVQAHDSALVIQLDSGANLTRLHGRVVLDFDFVTLSGPPQYYKRIDSAAVLQKHQILLVK